MASISQTKYIDIKSGVNNTISTVRDLCGLVFSTEDMSGSGDTVTAYNNGDIISFSNSDDVLKYFGSGSDAHEFATRYFGYVSPSGTNPTTLKFIKMGIDDKTETPADALEYANGSSGNFGSFTFLDSESTASWTDAQIKAAGAKNSGYNFRYLMCQGIVWSSASDAAAYAGASGKYGNSAGFCLTVGNDKYCAYMPMAIFAATDYDAVNSTTNFMFKQFDNEVAVVKSDADYDLLSGKTSGSTDVHVNFYGQTQSNGKIIAFYQRGFNLDGTDTAVYCNEIWLKSSIESDFFNLLTTVEKVPANSDGEAMIITAISDTVTQAIANGTILVGKQLTSSDRTLVIQLAGNREAVDDIINNGYNLALAIVKEENDFIAKYRLIYSKGDSIRKVEGNHNLI